MNPNTDRKESLKKKSLEKHGAKNIKTVEKIVTTWHKTGCSRPIIS